MESNCKEPVDLCISDTEEKVKQLVVDGAATLYAVRAFVLEIDPVRVESLMAEHAKACLALADMLLEGTGGLPDYSRARDYFEKAAAQKLDLVVRAKAYLGLSSLFFLGKGVNLDLEKGRNFLKKAATQKGSMETVAIARSELVRFDLLVYRICFANSINELIESTLKDMISLHILKDDVLGDRDTDKRLDLLIRSLLSFLAEGHEASEKQKSLLGNLLNFNDAAARYIESLHLYNEFHDLFRATVKEFHQESEVLLQLQSIYNNNVIKSDELCAALAAENDVKNRLLALLDNAGLLISFYKDKVDEWHKDRLRAVNAIELGDSYLKGCNGQPPNYQAAIECYEKAAWRSYFIPIEAAACFKLGCIFDDGIGVKRDISTAFEYFQRATLQKEDLRVRSAALYRIGKQLHYSKKFSQAREYLARAAAEATYHNERILSHLLLGEHYFYGLDADVDLQRARVHFQFFVVQCETLGCEKSDLVELARFRLRDIDSGSTLVARFIGKFLMKFML